MGGTESSEGRRVSFGMDEEERVRVLQGIRVSGSPVGARSERGRGRAGGEGVRGCGGRAVLRGGAQRERACAPRLWSTAYSGGEHLFLRPVNGEGEARKMLRVPAQGVATTAGGNWRAKG